MKLLKSARLHMTYTGDASEEVAASCEVEYRTCPAVSFLKKESAIMNSE